MTIGILKIDLFLPESNSLKAKRMILHSLKSKVRNSFNVGITQIDDADKWQKATLAVVGVDKDRKNMNSILSKVVDFIHHFNRINLIDYEMELI